MSCPNQEGVYVNTAILFQIYYNLYCRNKPPVSIIKQISKLNQFLLCQNARIPSFVSTYSQVL